MLATRIPLLACLIGSALWARPAIFFTDIESGPNSGGHLDQGAPITIYGNGFGAVRGSSRVTIGGVEVADYIHWGSRNAPNQELDRIVVQPGSRVTGGAIVVTVGEAESNGVPFAVRPGRIFLISVAGSDANDCSFERPCATVSHVVNDVMQPGDTVLVRGGTYGITSFQLKRGGAAGLPMAVLAYPRDEVFVGNGGTVHIDASYVTLGGIQFLGADVAATGTSGIRLVGNVPGTGVSVKGNALVAGNFCGANRSSCIHIRDGDGARVLNNRVSGVSVLLSRDVIVDGNTIGEYPLASGMSVMNVDGFIARNNVLTGNNLAGLRVVVPARGVKLLNNTFFQNGRAGLSVEGAGALDVEIRNNLFFQTMSFCVVSCDTVPLAHIAIMNAPDAVAGSVTIERNYYQTPQPVIYGGTDASPVLGEVYFYDALGGNYRLQPGSAAIDAGVAIAGEDRDGQARPQGNAADVGAYEYPDDSSVVPPGEPGPTPGVPGGAAGDPVIFFTDLESGPNSGGENGGGAVVTIYGKDFGAARGASTVTVGGGEVAEYKQWGVAHQWYEKIAVQLGAGARSGNLVVTVGGHASNGVPFTVRGGNIYFLGPGGSDANDGSFAKPWRNAPAARDRMKPGDIVYLLDGFSQTNDDGQGWNTPLLFRSGGGADAPLTWAAYPGATATLGSLTGPGFGIRMADRDPFGYIVFAGIRFRGSVSGALAGGVTAGAPGYRFIGNDFEGRSGSCVITQYSRGLVFQGNTAHDCGATSRTPELEHGVYFSTDSNGIDMSWNTVRDIPSCRGIQVHSSPLEGLSSGFNQYNIRIHHNLIRDTYCDGIVLATVDPSKGAVEVFNNVFLRAGYGTPIQQHGYFSCFYSPGTTNIGAAGSGTVEVYNNTMVNCGNSRAGNGWTATVTNGGQNARLGVRLRNNIIVASPGVPYALYGPLTGSNNLFFGGIGVAPASLSATIVGDPRLASSTDFHLKTDSPAVDMGIATGVPVDFEGAARPAGSEVDIGAYEFRP